MRAQCSICSDLFDGEAEIAAVIHCGHTFHDSCLLRWFEQSKTCPQCRDRVTAKGVIHKLYFDEADESDCVATPSKLQNQVSTLKASLREKDRDLLLQERNKESLIEKINQLKQEKKTADKSLKAEKTACLALREQLTRFQKQEQEYGKNMAELDELRSQVTNYTMIQSVIEGLTCDIQEMISNHKDLKQLATWCCVLKRELSFKNTECKKYKEQHDRINKENTMRKRDLLDKSKALANVREQLKGSEEDLKKAEQKIEKLKRRIISVHSATETPSKRSADIGHRSINESPAPLQPEKKRRLSAPLKDGLIEIDLNETPDLFSDHESPGRSKPSPATQTKQVCQEYGTKFIKITKAAEKCQSVSESAVLSHVLPLSMNIMKKKTVGASGFMKKGYNGLGGHEKFVQPFVQPSSSYCMKKPGKLSSKMRNMGPAPALPTLDLLN